MGQSLIYKIIDSDLQFVTEMVSKIVWGMIFVNLYVYGAFAYRTNIYAYISTSSQHL